MGGVSVDLGTLARAYGVLDGQLVQPQLHGQLMERLGRWLDEIDPDHRVPLGEIVGNVGYREGLGFEHAVAIDPRRDVAHRTGQTDSRPAARRRLTTVAPRHASDRRLGRAMG